MESTAITFDQPPYMVGGLSEKLDRVLELVEKVGVANHFNQLKHKRRMVYAKEAYTIMKCPSRQDLRGQSYYARCGKHARLIRFLLLVMMPVILFRNQGC